MDIKNNDQTPDGYKNFNEYQPQEIPQPQNAGSQIPQPQTLPQGYYAPVQPQQTSNTNGILSIVLGLFGCCCYGLPAVAGLILGIIGVKNNKSDTLSIVGLVISGLAIACWIYSIVVLALNWDFYMETCKELMEQMTELTAELENVSAAFISSIK